MSDDNRYDQLSKRQRDLMRHCNDHIAWLSGNDKNGGCIVMSGCDDEFAIGLIAIQIPKEHHEHIKDLIKAVTDMMENSMHFGEAELQAKVASKPESKTKH